MNEVGIKSVAEFIGATVNKFDYGYMFRGVEDVDNHKLIPSVGRYLEKYLQKGFGKANLLKDEQGAFRIFYKEAVQHVRCSSYFEWLAVAQHHGLATRLMDWSYSPLVALYFSCYKSPNTDGAVYVLDRDVSFISVSEESATDPFEIKKVSAYLPAHGTSRIRAQSGLFTIHPDPTEPLSDGIVGVILIPKGAKKEIKSQLNILGIHHKSLFPDVDGLSSWVRWMKFDCLDH